MPAGARSVRLADAPTISVVVASCRERHLLEACLEALLPQCRQVGAEVVVARAAGDVGALAHAYPAVQFIAAASDTPMPKLRAAGLAEADGDIVALTEDHCVVATDWLMELIRAKEAHGEAIDAALQGPRHDPPTDWAAYFAEHGILESGNDRPGQSALPSGANSSNGRRVLERLIAWVRQRIGQ